MAQIILAQMQEALRALMAAGSHAFGDAMAEEGEASRQIALLQSVAMMVGKLRDGVGEDDACAHWTRQLLQMLEDNAPAAAADVPAMLQFYKAIAAMQALLGVQEDRRAWNPEIDRRGEQDPTSDGIGSGYSGSLADLPGTPGKRADVALGCAVEIAETASWLLAEMSRMPCDYERPFSRLLKEIKRQAGLVIAACDDDEVTLAELQERAA